MDAETNRAMCEIFMIYLGCVWAVLLAVACIVETWRRRG